MTQLFYILGANINLKQAFLTSLPKVLANGAEMYIQNIFGSILNHTPRQIRQAIFLAFEDICNKRGVIHDYLKGNVCIDQACKNPELEIKGSCIDCKKKKKKRRFKKFKVSDKVQRRIKWKFFRKKRRFGAKKKGDRCFICNKKGHYAPSRAKIQLSMRFIFCSCIESN